MRIGGSKDAIATVSTGASWQRTRPPSESLALTRLVGLLKRDVRVERLWAIGHSKCY